MSDNADKPVPYRQLLRDFPQSTYKRALSLIEETGNIALAHRQLKAELEAEGAKVPSYPALWLWARQHKELIDQVRADKREEIIAISGEVAIAAAERMLGALETISDSQAAVSYGIAMQRHTEWERTGKSSAPMVALQFNWTKRGEPEELEGEAKQVPDSQEPKP